MSKTVALRLSNRTPRANTPVPNLGCRARGRLVRIADDAPARGFQLSGIEGMGYQPRVDRGATSHGDWPEDVG